MDTVRGMKTAEETDDIGSKIEETEADGERGRWCKNRITHIYR